MDRMQHPEAMDAIRVGVSRQEAPIEQGADAFEDITVPGPGPVYRLCQRPGDRFGRLISEASSKHGQTTEDGLILLLEQVVGPIDCSPQRLMPRRHVQVFSL